MLDIVFINSTQERSFTEAWFRRIITTVLKYTPYRQTSVSVSINLIEPKRMRTLNATHRHKDAPTDVLSFPLQYAETRIAKKGALIPLGDLFLCPSVIKARAKEQRTAYKTHLQFLTIHGLLHLAGYDHEKNEQDKRTMEAKERRIQKDLT